MFLIKLGGSIITDKTKECCFRQETVERLAKEIKKANQEIILVHGAGSFGHILAKKYDLLNGYKENKQLIGFAQTQLRVQQLNRLILESLHQQGLPAVSIPPHAMLTLDNHRPTLVNYSIIRSYLKKGFLPVTFGDVSLDTTLGFSICSGDLLMQMLAREFLPEKVIFVLDEDGLFAANPKTDPSASFIETATLKELAAFTTSLDDHADVTRGMEGKLETIKIIAQSGMDSILLNGNVHNRLFDTLQGKKTRCTVIRGEKT